jgi:hypothetical protein
MHPYEDQMSLAQPGYCKDHNHMKLPCPICKEQRRRYKEKKKRRD